MPTETLLQSLAVAATLTALTLCGLFVVGRVRRRSLAAAQQPELLHLLASALRNGSEIEDAVALVADLGPEPGRSEFEACHADLESGRPRDVALEELTERVDSFALSYTITAGMMLSGNRARLVEALDHLQEARSEQEQSRQDADRAARPIRGWTCAVLVGAPVLLGAFLLTVADYRTVFLQSPVGRQLFTTAILLGAISGIAAILLLSRLDRIERNL